MKRLGQLCLFGLALVLFSGCATNRVDAGAFKNTRRLALVSVVGVVEGVASTDQEDEVFMRNLATVAIQELDTSKHLRLVSESAVLHSRAYKSIKDQGPGLFQVLPKGYKKFDPRDETKALRALARDLKVDGFVSITAHYGTAKKGIGIGGLLPVPIPVSVGSEHARVNYFITAFNANGDVFWQDSVEKTAEEGIGTVMGVGQYKALHPQLTSLAKAATQQAVADLDAGLAGK